MFANSHLTCVREKAREFTRGYLRHCERIGRGAGVLELRNRRGVLQVLVTTAVMLVALVAVPPTSASAAAPVSVQAENALPGTPGWRYADAPYGTTAQQYAGVVTS